MDHSGSSFDSFLKQQGIREEVEAVAIKSVLARHETSDSQAASHEPVT